MRHSRLAGWPEKDPSNVSTISNRIQARTHNNSISTCPLSLVVWSETYRTKINTLHTHTDTQSQTNQRLQKLCVCVCNEHIWNRTRSKAEHDLMNSRLNKLGGGGGLRHFFHGGFQVAGFKRCVFDGWKVSFGLSSGWRSKPFFVHAVWIKIWTLYHYLRELVFDGFVFWWWRGLKRKVAIPKNQLSIVFQKEFDGSFSNPRCSKINYRYDRFCHSKRNSFVLKCVFWLQNTNIFSVKFFFVLDFSVVDLNYLFLMQVFISILSVDNGHAVCLFRNCARSLNVECVNQLVAAVWWCWQLRWFCCCCSSSSRKNACNQEEEGKKKVKQENQRENTIKFPSKWSNFLPSPYAFCWLDYGFVVVRLLAGKLTALGANPVFLVVEKEEFSGCSTRANLVHENVSFEVHFPSG